MNLNSQTIGPYFTRGIQYFVTFDVSIYSEIKNNLVVGDFLKKLTRRTGLMSVKMNFSSFSDPSIC